MAAKIITFLIVLLLNLGGGFFWYFMLALGLNGFSGSDADYSMTLFPIGAVVVSILAATAGFFAAGYLINGRSWNTVLAIFVAALALTTIGIAVSFLLMVAAIFLAEFMRTSRIKSK